MKLTIAQDAHSQVRTLLLATLLTLLLSWFVPFGGLITYPFRIFVTFIHEGAHALAALITGNSVHSLTVAVDGSGAVLSTSRSVWAGLFVSSAGYLGAMAFGALLLMVIRRTVAARKVLVSLAVYIAALTIGFGLVSPLAHRSAPGFFTLVAGILLTVGLAAAARYAPPRIGAFLVSFLAVQCVVNALSDLRNVFFLSAGTEVFTDARNMADATGIPAVVWSAMWIVLALALLALSLRAYAAKTSEGSPVEETAGALPRV